MIANDKKISATPQASHMVEDIVDVDGEARHRSVVAEHFQFIDEIADAVGFGAD